MRSIFLVIVALCLVFSPIADPAQGAGGWPFEDAYQTAVRAAGPGRIDERPLVMRFLGLKQAGAWDRAEFVFRLKKAGAGSEGCGW